VIPLYSWYVLFLCQAEPITCFFSPFTLLFIQIWAIPSVISWKWTIPAKNFWPLYNLEPCWASLSIYQARGVVMFSNFVYMDYTNTYIRKGVTGRNKNISDVFIATCISYLYVWCKLLISWQWTVWDIQPVCYSQEIEVCNNKCCVGWLDCLLCCAVIPVHYLHYPRVTKDYCSLTYTAIVQFITWISVIWVTFFIWNQTFIRTWIIMIMLSEMLISKFKIIKKPIESYISPYFLYIKT